MYGMKRLQTLLRRCSEHTRASGGHCSSHTYTHLSVGCSLENMCIQGSARLCCFFSHFTTTRSPGGGEEKNDHHQGPQKPDFYILFIALLGIN